MSNILLLLSAIILVCVDFVYLNLIKPYFAWQVKKVQQLPMEINYLGAVLCYIFLIFGINYFIIKPKKSVQDAFLLGLIIYGVFETTNYALFKNWSFLTVVIDTIWGGTLFALTTLLVDKIRNVI